MRANIALLTALILIALSGVNHAVAAENYGAIAYSPSSGANGYSWDHGNLRSAENTAMNGCRKHARDCKIVIWFKNACGAVSRGGRGGWGSAWGNSRAQAENKAYEGCRKHDNNCRTTVSVCSSR